MDGGTSARRIRRKYIRPLHRGTGYLGDPRAFQVKCSLAWIGRSDLRDQHDYSCDDDIRETPDTQQSVIEFPSYSLVWEHMIGCGIGPWQREHGCAFHGENGILVVDRGGWEVHSETDRFKQSRRVFRMLPTPRQAAQGDFHLEHVRNFVACVKTRQAPTADVEISHKSMTAPHLANIAVVLRRYVKWDPAGEKIIGDPQAQSLVGREYRKPWVLPS